MRSKSLVPHPKFSPQSLKDLMNLNINKQKRTHQNPPTITNDSVFSFPSTLQTKTTAKTTTTVNHNGSQLQLNFPPLRLLQFLFMELKAEVKEYVPKGNQNLITFSIRMFSVSLLAILAYSFD